jgi:hypothetical protein
MLFDLKGKRRRVVQGVYLTLAILIGGGLVLFGVGSNVGGGLGDLFKGGSGSNQADKAIQKKIDQANKTLVTQPKNQAALLLLVRSHYQLATSHANQSGQFTADAQSELVKTTQAWERYSAVNPKPPPTVARFALQAYDGLGQLAKQQADKQKAYGGAASVAETITALQPKNPEAWLILTQYASLAGQTRKADLAGQKAIQVAPKDQKSQVKTAVQQAKAAGATSGQPSQTGTGQ